MNWRECKMFSSALVTINDMLLDCHQGLPISPKCLHARWSIWSSMSVNIYLILNSRYIPGSESTIVMENPEYQGFKSLMDCQEILRKHETVLAILQRLATFHGCGLILRKRKCSDLSKIYSFLLKTDAYIMWRCNLFNSSSLNGKGNGLF